jgi:SAM-dependent methyltransferase
VSEIEDQLFLETTARLAPQSLADSDAACALRLLQLPPGATIADLGCGYGRHLSAFCTLGVLPLGIDRSALLLREAARRAPTARLLCGDLRALPLRDGVLAGATCFYSSFAMGTFGDARAALAEAARALRPGGRLVLTTDNPLRLEESPESAFVEEVVGLGRLVEQSRFDARARVDTVHRRLTRPDGSRLSATWRIRYYLPGELAELGRLAGLGFERLEPPGPLRRRSPQLVAILRRR